MSVMHCCVFFALHVAACIGSMVFEIYFRKLNTMLIFFYKARVSKQYNLISC